LHESEDKWGSSRLRDGKTVPDRQDRAQGERGERRVDKAARRGLRSGRWEKGREASQWLCADATVTRQVEDDDQVKNIDGVALRKSAIQTTVGRARPGVGISKTVVVCLGDGTRRVDSR
jgi:hypothetical protein